MTEPPGELRTYKQLGEPMVAVAIGFDDDMQGGWTFEGEEVLSTTLGEPELPLPLDAPALAAAKLQLQREGVIVLRSVRVSSEQLGELLAAAPAAANGGRSVRRVLFHDVRFTGPADLSRISFGAVEIVGSVFEADADFAGSTFKNDADFHQVTFAGPVSFGRVQFRGSVDFWTCEFADAADFMPATRFDGPADFMNSRFAGNARFTGANFANRVAFRDTAVMGRCIFSTAVFAGQVNFRDARVGGELALDGAELSGARVLGPLLCHRLDLEDAAFGMPVRIEVVARRLELDRVTFRAGGDVLVRWADVTLEGADFGAPVLLAGLPAFGGIDGSWSWIGYEQPGQDGKWRLATEPTTGFAPRLLSLRGAKVERLTLSRVDLSVCRMARAHNLDRLRLEGVAFAEPPSGWRPSLRRPRWTPRQVLFEERLWREEQGHGEGWTRTDDPTAPEWLDRASEPASPGEIAGLYRALRKGYEDDKNEPGAADFYYGEMEMRRLSSHGEDGARGTPAAERSVLWLYWLVAGYGLRASRALATLVATLVAATLILDTAGFQPDASFGDALLFACESAIGLLRPPTDGALTRTGEIVQLVLRLLGPVLLGLAAFSLRGRVKR